MALKVFISGPYTYPDSAVNVGKAIKAAEKVRDLGFIPYVPHLGHFWHLLFPRTYDDWLEQSMVWLEVCDLVLRLPGYSVGADKECELATTLSIPIAYSVWDLPNLAKEKVIGMG